MVESTKFFQAISPNLLCSKILTKEHHRHILKKDGAPEEGSEGRDTGCAQEIYSWDHEDHASREDLAHQATEEAAQEEKKPCNSK